MAELVANRYAMALFEVASENNTIESVQKDLRFIVDSLDENPKLEELFRSPLIKDKEIKQIMQECFVSSIESKVLNFLFVLVDKRRQNYIRRIANQFKILVDKANNVAEATAVTAEPMRDEDLVLLKEKLSKATKKNVSLINKVDTEVLGGILIKMGDKEIDGTVKRRLGELKEQLTKIIV
ncbi:MAG: F0F1 ATP synthase subunit delta [Clostridiales bacterium]|nr:F0F1 ATP synthase subunit delta [Clostridiales bacterium]